MSQHVFYLEVPLDASGIADFRPEKPVKVLVRDGAGKLKSEHVTLDERGHGMARFAFESRPRGLTVVVGPGHATDEQLLALQTINVAVKSRQLGDTAEFRLSPIRITAYYWWWWLRWCRNFVIRGRVVCGDGRPVPGAQVCAYDVNWWWWWWSKDLIGCATTDANGVFELDFTWCCGWWPWWWWSRRHWQLNPALVERIAPVLARDPGIEHLIQPRPQPSLADFRALLGTEAAHLGNASAVADPSVLSGLREKLLARLPGAPDLEQARIWPWWPWEPWWDCAPDVIVQVTQPCAANSATGAASGVEDGSGLSRRSTRKT